MTDDSPRMSLEQLLFEAGKLAFRKGWDDPELVTASHLNELPPSGPPVLLIATAEEITADSARTVASLTGAGRQVSVVTDGPLPPEIASWLSDDIVAYPNESEVEPDEGTDNIPERAQKIAGAQAHEGATGPEPHDSGVVLPDDTSWMEPTSPEVPDPYCEFVDPHESHEWQESPGALAFWNRFVTDRGLNVTVQPAEAGVPTIWGGRWSLFDQQTDGCLWLQFSPLALQVGGEWQQRVAVSSIIGHAPAIGSGLDRPASEQQRQFANQVTAFCEISEAAAMMSRGFGGARWGTINDLRLGEDAAFGNIGATSLPRRYIELTPADTVLLIGPQGAVEVPLPDGLAAVRLVYLVPITVDAAKSADVLAHSIDAITRTHRLLWNPSADLDGRRNPERAAPLQAFLESVGFVSYGGAAQILWEAR